MTTTEGTLRTEHLIAVLDIWRSVLMAHGKWSDTIDENSWDAIFAAITERDDLKARLAEYVRRARELTDPEEVEIRDVTKALNIIRDLAAEKVEP